ncbi:sensor histidine kinase [Actinoallomurus iriomotensis]|uniref:histidine kinase n=1 Tax=Actinoallomurus iriomotensis TaxID=478107 RepID=A0A9W6VWT1_9ACTN|nr:HAMP domain-containing sensor histidine kinase [Actinoallomurus iriomotensis]GLY88178.1 two-component sensor histidine kinase [Actinoallomurus iriomotensis]
MIGLRARLVAGFTAVAVLASVLTSAIAYFLVRRVLLDRVQNNAIMDVRSTLAQAIPARLPYVTYSPDLLQPFGDALARPGWQCWIMGNQPGGWVTTGEKYSWVHIPPQLITAVRASRPGSKAHGDTLPGRRLVYQRIVSRGVPYLVVGTPIYLPKGGISGPETRFGRVTAVGSQIEAYVIISLRHEQSDLNEMAALVAVGGAIAGAVALLIALLAARSVLRPVRLLSEAARGLGDGDLDRRVEVRGRDELARLARTYNDSADALQASVAELREMEASARRFAADVSHELRTPLTTMVAVTDTLEEEVSGDAATAAGLVAEEIRRLSALVGDLLEISRFDAGAVDLVADDVDMAELVAQSLRLRGWNRDVELDLEAGLRIHADPRRIDVILANLVGNALKYGSPPVTVWSRKSSDPDGAWLRVEDHGPGIPAEARAHVFDRFYRVDTARTRGKGTGLGLAIARANAELHGGTLDLLDTDAGTVFELWLPTDQRETE